MMMMMIPRNQVFDFHSYSAVAFFVPICFNMFLYYHWLNLSMNLCKNITGEFSSKHSMLSNSPAKG